MGKTPLTIYVMRGLPGSGKSTRAAELSREVGAEIVNRDNLRMALHGVWWSGDPSKEDEVTFFEKSLVVDNLKKGDSVIIDATHLHPSAVRAWETLAAEYGAEIQIVDVFTGVDECIKRDAARAARGERAVGAEVILRMEASRVKRRANVTKSTD